MTSSNSPSRESELERQQNARLRESMATLRFIRLGYRPIAIGENEIRAHFGFEGQCVDMVFCNRKNTCLIAESKGSSIGDAIQQLRNTAIHVGKKFSHIEAQIVLSWPGAPPAYAPVGSGCTAIKQQLGGAHILFDATGQSVRVRPGEYVQVVFGP